MPVSVRPSTEVGTGTGVATVNGSGGLGHLNTLQLPGGGITVTGTAPQTDPDNATFVTLILDPNQPLILGGGTKELEEAGTFQLRSRANESYV